MEEDLKEIKKLLSAFMQKYNVEVEVMYDNERNVFVSAKLSV